MQAQFTKDAIFPQLVFVPPMFPSQNYTTLHEQKRGVFFLQHAHVAYPLVFRLRGGRRPTLLSVTFSFIGL